LITASTGIIQKPTNRGINIWISLIELIKNKIAVAAAEILVLEAIVKFKLKPVIPFRRLQFSLRIYTGT
jgi:hypothetical protein